MTVVEGEAPHRESLGDVWSRQPDWAKRLIKTGVVLAVLFALAFTDQLKRSGQFWALVVVVVAALNWRSILAVFWWALDAVGVKDAKRRWSRQSPIVRRAIPPVAIALPVIFLTWAAGTPPSPAVLVLLGICYALYVMPAHIRKYALPLTVLTLAVAYPLYLDKLFEIPVFKAFPSMDTMVAITLFAMMAIGLNMVVGYAGLLDLGFVAFYAIGAYTAGWLASPHFAQYGIDFNFWATGVPEGIGGIHITIWLVVLIAAGLTAFGGILIGLPTLRLRGDYLAIVTLGFGEIVQQVARNGSSDGTGFNLTNGPPGINPIDPPGFGGYGNFVLQNGTYVNFVDLIYWAALALLLITIFCSIRLRDSRLGRAWIAIREDETAAAAMGIPLMRTKTWAYAGGAFFGGAAGAWYGTYKSGVFPDDFFFNISIFILCMVILGGMGNVWGVIAGAAFLTYLDREGLANISGWINENITNCDPTAADPARPISGGCLNGPLLSFGIYGAIIVLVMLFRPGGLIPERRRLLEVETGVHDQPLYDVQSAGAHEVVDETLPEDA
jgi:branched-chain amino acid transport system permease protein